MTTPHRFYMPTDVRCGAGALAALDEARGWGGCPAILCGMESARRYGHLDAVRAHFPHAVILEGFPENPTFTHCERYAENCRGADLIIALGGGSVLDGAKALALLVPNGGRCGDYLDGEPDRAPLPVIAIPTTAGTGSEVTQYAVLVDPERHRKVTLRSPRLFPRLALLDPALTRTLPRHVTLATALDALSQAMEGMLSRRATPAGDALAVDVCRTIHTWLPAVLNDPNHNEGREKLLHAAMLSGVIIAQSGTTLVHGMGYYFTLDHQIAHGVANALLLPPVFWWNAHHNPEKVARLAAALGHPCPATPAAAARAISEALYHFYDKIHFSYSASAHGVPEATLRAMGTDIARDSYRFKNQIGTFSEKQVIALYQAAWRGSVDGLRPPDRPPVPGQ